MHVFAVSFSQTIVADSVGGRNCRFGWKFDFRYAFDLPKLPSRTDALVSGNLTVSILGECWSPILESANPAAVNYDGHVALRQTEIGQLWTPNDLAGSH